VQRGVCRRLPRGGRLEARRLLGRVFGVHRQRQFVAWRSSSAADLCVQTAAGGGSMKNIRALPIAVMMAIPLMAQSDPWTALCAFEGKWEGPTAGKPGKGTTSREYRFELNGRFLSQSDKSVYQPDDPAAKPLVHEDFGVFSYDKNLKKVIWRQFHSEGMVNEYTLDSVSADGKSLEFVTTKIENLPPGFRAKKVYQIVSAEEMVETFWLAPPGKELELYTESHLTRIK
jgi:hypothetical protein